MSSSTAASSVGSISIVSGASLGFRALKEGYIGVGFVCGGSFFR